MQFPIIHLSKGRFFSFFSVATGTAAMEKNVKLILILMEFHPLVLAAPYPAALRYTNQSIRFKCEAGVKVALISSR